MSGTQTSGVVTPEAVVLQFDTAGLGSRVAAFIIDFIIRLVLIGAFVLVAAALDQAGGPAWLAVTIATFGIFGTVFLYSVIWETLWDGRTPGKAAFGLRVVTVEGGPIRFRHAAIRGALAVFEIILLNGVIAAIAIVVTYRNQRLGDIVGGTLVLRERKATPTPVATQFVPPPGTEEFALSLDVSSMTADEYITVRSYLLRAAGLEARARQALSDQLGRQFATLLRVNPPTWMPSEIFLVCVAAAYQRRFAAR